MYRISLSFMLQSIHNVKVAWLQEALWLIVNEEMLHELISMAYLWCNHVCPDPDSLHRQMLEVIVLIARPVLVNRHIPFLLCYSWNLSDVLF